MIAAEHAEFWLPEMERGFLASAGAVQRLPRKIPYNVAMELFLTGRHMGAEEAKHWGLVSEVVPADRLMERSRELAEQLSEGAPLATQALKAILPAHGVALGRRHATHQAWPKRHQHLRENDEFGGLSGRTTRLRRETQTAMER